MEPVKFYHMKRISVTLVIVCVVFLFSCGESANDANNDDNDRNAGQDSTITGLEGTRDQAAQLQTDVTTDTSSGQNVSVGEKPDTGGLPGNTGSSTNEQFIAEEIAANYGEIKSATLAQENSDNKDIKAIAATLIKEHTSGLADLKSIGLKKGFNLPAGETADAKNKLTAIEKRPGLSSTRHGVI